MSCIRLTRDHLVRDQALGPVHLHKDLCTVGRGQWNRKQVTNVCKHIHQVSEYLHFWSEQHHNKHHLACYLMDTDNLLLAISLSSLKATAALVF